MKLATVANMEAHADDPTVVAYSPTTGEQCSANPGDYFWMGSDKDVLVDSEGEPMILARRVSFMEEL